MPAVTAFHELIAALDAAGLWSEVAENQRRACIAALGSGGDVTWAAGGAWRADGEDLAEGEVEEWLGRMAVPLHDCGIELRVATVCGPWDEGSAGYSVSVNGTVLNLYTFSPEEPGLPATEDPWQDCTVEPAGEVNRLLAAAGSTRRVAVFWPGGNDGFAVSASRVSSGDSAGTASSLDNRGDMDESGSLLGPVHLTHPKSSHGSRGHETRARSRSAMRDIGQPSAEPVNQGAYTRIAETPAAPPVSGDQEAAIARAFSA